MAKTPPTDHPLKTLAKISGMGLQMGLIIYAGNQLGVYLDLEWGLQFMELVCSMLSIALAVYGMIQQAKRL